ncbi:protein-L-isoaspartate O-methyltransferase-like protein [Endogone sp. FLAS-F59071]|nr:protein-L-isoaspartate O-methyltransferase-like protein [Endogone sp. FLAS-F59071]|eukprot:RUS13633.1 protein-L-isoaspartate O-methyltransferase-like protein [Endogone sp. FLAS-F59071]
MIALFGMSRFFLSRTPHAPAPLLMLLLTRQTTPLASLLLLSVAQRHNTDSIAVHKHAQLLAKPFSSSAPNNRAFPDPAKMAWRCSGNTNDELIDNLKKSNIINNDRVVRAMKAVNRANYVSQEPYRDCPQVIGYGATISAPHMHAHALEYLEPYLKPGMKVLDVGSGSGYLTSCMAEMVGPDGKVVGLEHIPELVSIAEDNVRRDQPDLLDSGKVRFVVGDGREGFPEEAPFDCMWVYATLLVLGKIRCHVGAAADKLPKALVNQLKAPGRYVLLY